MLQKKDLYKIYQKLLKGKKHEPKDLSPLVREFIIQFNEETPFEVLFEKAIFSYLKSIKKERWLIDLLYENLKIDKNIGLDYAIDLQIDGGNIFYTEKLLGNEQFMLLLGLKKEKEKLNKIYKNFSLIIIPLFLLVGFIFIIKNFPTWLITEYLPKTQEIQLENKVTNNKINTGSNINPKDNKISSESVKKPVSKPVLSSPPTTYINYTQNSGESKDNIFEIDPIVYGYFRKRIELPGKDGTLGSFYPGTYFYITLPKTRNTPDLLFKFQYTKGVNTTLPIPYGYKLIYISEGNISSDEDGSFVYYGNKSGIISYGLKKILNTEKGFELVNFVNPSNKGLTVESSVLTYSMKQHYWSKQSFLSTELKEQLKKVLNEEKDDKVKTLLRFANDIKTKEYNSDYQKFFAFEAKGSIQKYYDILFKSKELECYSSARLFLSFAQELGFEGYIIQGFHHYENSSFADNPNYINSKEAHAWTEILINKKRYIFDVTPSIIDGNTSNNIEQSNNSIDISGIVEFFQKNKKLNKKDSTVSDFEITEKYDQVINNNLFKSDRLIPLLSNDLEFLKRFINHGASDYSELPQEYLKSMLNFLLGGKFSDWNNSQVIKNLFVELDTKHISLDKTQIKQVNEYLYGLDDFSHNNLLIFPVFLYWLLCFLFALSFKKIVKNGLISSIGLLLLLCFIGPAFFAFLPRFLLDSLEFILIIITLGIFLISLMHIKLFVFVSNNKILNGKILKYSKFLLWFFWIFSIFTSFYLSMLFLGFKKLIMGLGTYNFGLYIEQYILLIFSFMLLIINILSLVGIHKAVKEIFIETNNLYKLLYNKFIGKNFKEKPLEKITFSKTEEMNYFDIKGLYLYFFIPVIKNGYKKTYYFGLTKLYEGYSRIINEYLLIMNEKDVDKAILLIYQAFGGKIKLNKRQKQFKEIYKEPENIFDSYFNKIKVLIQKYARIYQSQSNEFSFFKKADEYTLSKNIDHKKSARTNSLIEKCYNEQDEVNVYLVINIQTIFTDSFKKSLAKILAIKNLKIRNILFVDNQNIFQIKGNISINSIFENIKNQVLNSRFTSRIADNKTSFLKNSPITLIKGLELNKVFLIEYLINGFETDFLLSQVPAQFRKEVVLIGFNL